MASGSSLFDQLVFSGGGLRCFWQGGFLHVLRRARPVEPVRISGVSGGALSAMAFIGHRGEDLRERMCEAFSRQDSNVDWDGPIDGERITPHQKIYREVVEAVLDNEVHARVAEGPDCQILIAHPPSGHWRALTGSAVALAYEAELKIRSTPHFEWPEMAGVTMERVDARAVAREGRLVELVAAAATIPPIFEVPTWNGRPVIDGGMADQAPMPVPDEGRTLVLLTRRYRTLPQVPGRRYVMPSEAVEVDKIDFTSPDKVRKTWQEGERDAKAFLETLD